MESEGETQGFWPGYFYTINCIIGSGVLAVPWAYAEGGWLLGLLCQGFTTAFSLILAYQIIQIMSRMQVLSKLSKNGYIVNPVNFAQLFHRTHPENFIISRKDYKDTSVLLEIEDNPQIKETRFDLTEMISVLLGKNGGKAFGLLLFVSIFGVLVAFSSIFASSMASALPIFNLSTCNIYEDASSFGDDCWKKYWFYLMVMLSVVTVLVLIGLKEQAGIQAAMSVMRFVVIGVLICTSLAARISDTSLDSSDENQGELPFFNIFGVGLTLPIIFMASAFHSTIPNTIQYVRNKNTNVPLIINSAIATVTVIFVVLGLAVPLGVSDIEGMITINYIDYTGGQDEQSWWSYIIMYTIVLFPAFDVLSVFPILAINLSDNLISLTYGKFDDNTVTQKGFLIYRLVVVILPITTAVFVYNLGLILDFTGSVALLASGVFIPLMSISSRKLVPQHGDFDYWFSSDIWAWFILISSILLFLVIWTFLFLWIF